MKRVVLLVILVAAIAGGGVVAWAATAGPDTDPAPPAASKDVPGVVSLARPIPAVRVASKPASVIDLGLTGPGGVPFGVASFHETRSLMGEAVDRRCATVGPVAKLRVMKLVFGNCLDASTREPWAITVGASSEGTATISGIASSRVRRLTVAGPGGTFVVPRSRGGAFYVLYGKRATGRAVLTGTLADGTTRFFRTSIPPDFRPPAGAEAKDPGTGPVWTASALERPAGPSERRNCVSGGQLNAIRARTPARRGGVALAAICGDLSKHPVFARTTTLRPGRQPSVSGAFGPIVPRTILMGVAAASVKEVEVSGPGGRRALPLADAGRAFITVYPGRVKAAELTLEVTLADGTVQRYPNPASVNGGALIPQPPRYVKTILRSDPRDARRTRITILLDGPSPRVSVKIRGRTIMLRRTARSRGNAAYAGAYRVPAGQRAWSVGAEHTMLVAISCGSPARRCSTTFARGRVR